MVPAIVGEVLTVGVVTVAVVIGAVGVPGAGVVAVGATVVGVVAIVGVDVEFGVTTGVEVGVEPVGLALPVVAIVSVFSSSSHFLCANLLIANKKVLPLALMPQATPIPI